MKPGGFIPPVLFWRVLSSPPDVRKEGDRMYVTYADLFQFCIFICALVGLCYTIFKGRKKLAQLQKSKINIIVVRVCIQRISFFALEVLKQQGVGEIIK